VGNYVYLHTKKEKEILMNKQLYKWVDDNEQVLLDELCTLLRQPSIASTNTGIRGCAELTLKMMKDAGIDAKLYETEGSPIIVGHVKGADSKTILLYGHYDVQPPDPVELWNYDPFGAEIVDGKIYARGSIDDKGNFMCAVHAVKAYHDMGLIPPVNMVFLIEGEEEVSSINLPEFMRKHKDILKADALLDLDDCVQPDGKTGRPKVVTGEKGNCYIELVCEIRREFHSMMAPIIPNPAWRLVWALSTMKDVNERITIDNFYDEIRQNTIAEHAIIEDMESYWDSNVWLKESGQEGYLCGNKGAEVLKRLYFEPTCNICGIKGGYIGEGRKTIIPEKASVKIDFRMVPGQSKDQILTLLRKHLDKRGFEDVQINYLGGSHWFRSPVDHPAALAIREAVLEGFECPPAVLITYPGSGPGDIFEEILGIPQVCSGFGPLGDRLHAPNEYMTVDFYIKGVKTIISFYEIYAQK
jgi:acetylornithine deacetylase/succinyl-diaminopimelate desuccinylase-like protein